MAKLPPCMRRLRKKFSRPRSWKTSSDPPDAAVESERTSQGLSSDGQSPDERQFDRQDPASYVDSVSRALTIQEDGRTIAVLAPTYELFQRLQAAVRNNRQIREAEEEFLAFEGGQIEELERIRAEGEALLTGKSSSTIQQKVEKLALREEDIMQELERRHRDVIEMWVSVREKTGELFDALDEVFVSDGLLKSPSGTKKARTQTSRGGADEEVSKRQLGEGSTHEHTKAQMVIRNPRASGKGGGSYEESIRSHALRGNFAIANEVANTIASDPKLAERMQEALKDNRHMKQFEMRVLELYDFEEELISRIQEGDRPFLPSSKGSVATGAFEWIGELKQKRKQVHADLERFQSDAEVKWIMMPDNLRAVLDPLDVAFVNGGELRAEDGYRDIDTDQPMLETSKARKQGAEGVELLKGRAETSTSEVSPTARIPRTALRMLSRKSKTHHDLRAEVERLELELDERMEFERRLLHDYIRARDDVEEAQRHFDMVEVRHDQEEERFQNRLAAGSDVGSPTEFGLKLLLDKQRLTRDLVEAEDDYEVAKAKALDEGIHLGNDDRSSGFLSRESDGYRESGVVEAVRSIEADEFLKWMRQVPEDSNPDDPDLWPEVDEWESRSVVVSDSISAVAWGSDRRRIDRWLQRE